MFLYCFDPIEKDKLQMSNKLYKETIMDNKPCWIFVINKTNKLTFDKSKCFISNKMTF